MRAFIVPLAFCTPIAAAALFIDRAGTTTLPTERRTTLAEQLIEEHDCWTGRPPADMAGQVPGHVVVTHDGRTSYNARLVGPALEQLFEGAEHGLTVHAFCR